MILQMTEKVPQVDGNSSELMNELMEGMCDEGDGWGKDKFCTNRYCPAFPGFSTRDNGDDWNGLIRERVSTRESGPM